MSDLLRVTIPEADMGFCAITCNLSSAGSCNVGLSEIRCTGGHDRPGPRCNPGEYLLVPAARWEAADRLAGRVLANHEVD